MLCACHGLNPHPTYTNTPSEETMALRNKYQKLLVGSWYYEDSTDRHRIYEQYTLQANDSLTGHIKFASRQLVSIKGQQVYTDWEIEEDDTIKHGTWALYFDKDLQKSMIYINHIHEPGKSANSVYYEFRDAGNEYAHWRSTWRAKIVEFKRGNLEPSF